MALGKVCDMNVIPNTSSIRSRIVVSENAQLLPLTRNDFLDEWKEVVGVDIRLVAYQARLVSTAGVEVSKRNDSPVLVKSRQGTK